MTDAFPAVAAAIRQVLEGQGFTRLVTGSPENLPICAIDRTTRSVITAEY